MNYRSIPALAAYIDRIGAEELNFRRFMVKDHRGHYYKQKALITIGQDRTIHCSSLEYAPTEEEEEAINHALATVQWPTSIKASPAQVDELRRTLRGEGELYEFYDQADMFIIMVQQRLEPNNGTVSKIYKPWTYWSDGQWRDMEPDGTLPFWKPRINSQRSRIMIHEGAKAAKIVTDLLASPEGAQHPWFEFLNQYEHWGMIGGALAPHRTNYDELRRRNPAEVIYICDNDQQGKDALPVISRMWRRALKGVYFDDRWPAGWDMGDPLPRDMFTGGTHRFKGPMLDQLLFSATWATEQVPTGPKGGKMTTTIRPDFAEEWLHCTSPEVFVHRMHPNIILDENAFNSRVRPFSDVDDTARILKRSSSSKTGALQYIPAETSGYKAGRGDGSYINTYKPSYIKPIEGDPTPWLDFMQYLIPDETNRTELLRWIATLVARPAIKMTYGVLLISETQGIGKGTLGEKVLYPILGRHNVGVPLEAEVVDSNFNYWAAHNRMALIHEIYAGQSAKAYNKLKSIITDRYINVNKKFQAAYQIENWLHVFACSNSLRALQLSGDDRRWLVPRVTEEKKPYSYWRNFNKWLRDEDGLGIIVWWCHEFLKTNDPVLEGVDAPMTAAKRDMIEEGFSPGQTLVLNFLRLISERMNGHAVYMLDTELQNMIREHIYEGKHSDRIERTRTIRKVAEAAGWHVNPTYARLAQFGTRGLRAKIITNKQELVRVDPTQLTAMTEVQHIDVLQQAQQFFTRNNQM